MGIFSWLLFGILLAQRLSILVPNPGTMDANTLPFYLGSMVGARVVLETSLQDESGDVYLGTRPFSTKPHEVWALRGSGLVTARPRIIQIKTRDPSSVHATEHYNIDLLSIGRASCLLLMFRIASRRPDRGALLRKPAFVEGASGVVFGERSE